MDRFLDGTQMTRSNIDDCESNVTNLILLLNDPSTYYRNDLEIRWLVIPKDGLRKQDVNLAVREIIGIYHEYKKDPPQTLAKLIHAIRRFYDMYTNRTYWFRKAFGIGEDLRPGEIQNEFQHDVVSGILKCVPSGKILQSGHFATKSLENLKVAARKIYKNTHNAPHKTVDVVVGNVQDLLRNPEYNHATFQVASQFNCLEMIASNIDPSYGISIYEHDRTQGPACSIACGAGTLYRNYLHVVDARYPSVRGQSKYRQINHSKAFLEELLPASMDSGALIQNGYLIPTPAALKHLQYKDENIIRTAMDKLEVGVHTETEVTLRTDLPQYVTQVFTSAMPIDRKWKSDEMKQARELANAILLASFKAVLYASQCNIGSNIVVLTLLGAGAFNNKMQDVVEQMVAAIHAVDFKEMDVRINCYDKSTADVVRGLISKENFKPRETIRKDDGDKPY
jgi:hypothetical protein